MYNTCIRARTPGTKFNLKKKFFLELMVLVHLLAGRVVFEICQPNVYNNV